MMIITLVYILNGRMWIEYSAEFIASWLVIIAPILTTTAGAVATYSFVHYTQNHELRNLVTVFMALDVVLLSFLFLITHPSFESWAPLFADRQRNRSIAIAIGLAIMPGVLLGSFAGQAPVSKRNRNLYTVWGGIIMPILSLWFFLSPQPVFISTDPSGGLKGLTPIAILFVLVIGVSWVISFFRYAREWYNTRNRVAFSSAIALVTWLSALILVSVLTSPFQVAELIWFSLVIEGFVLIGISMIITSVIDPHRALEDLVTTRTKELQLSQRESEFYLDMWSHKVGNLLQGLLTYLEILKDAVKDAIEDDVHEVALRLTNEAILVNRQVTNLSRIKKESEQFIKKVQLLKYIDLGIKNASELVPHVQIEADVHVHENAMVMADELLDLVFTSIVLRAIGECPTDILDISIHTESIDQIILVEIEYSGKPIDTTLLYYDFDTVSPSRSIGLEFFTIHMLLHRYDSQLEYVRDDGVMKNILKLWFKTSKL